MKVQCQFCQKEVEINNIKIHFHFEHNWTFDDSIRKHPCPFMKCNKNKHLFKYNNLFKHISNNHNIKIDSRTKVNVEERIEKKIIVSEVQISQNNVEDIKVKAMKYAKQIDQYAGEFLLEAGYINDKQLFGLSQLIKNILSSCDSLVALESLNFLTFNKKNIQDQCLVDSIELEGSARTVSRRKMKSEIPKCYFVNFQKDIQMYTNKYLQLNNFQKTVKIVLYVDDVCPGNALSPFKKNNMYTHICYKVLDDNVKCSNLEHYRSLGITKSKFVKPFKYHDVVQKTIRLIETTIFVHQNIERNLKIAYVIGDNEFMNILFKTPLNYRAQGTNNCKACNVGGRDWHKFMKCSLIKEQLKNDHAISGIPIDNNLLSDPFHDLNLGVLSNVLFGTTQIVQIITDLTPLQIYEGIINECILMKKHGCINSVINENFFALQRTQDTLSKKGRYLLNGSQTLTVTRVFYEYLIKININNYENGVKIKFKQIINLLKVLLNVTYLCMEFDMDINECSRLHRKVHNESMVENNNWIYDLPVIECDEDEQLEASMEEEIKELSFIISEE
uniref:C2H2-type domain-containing protein n=1 Tax=Strongyloides papillosus TaxID=174720 RepID=A0A0N5C6H5_STREA